MKPNGESRRRRRMDAIRARKKQIIAAMDQGKHLPDPQRELYQAMSDKHLRDQALMPTMLWVALTYLYNIEGKVVREDLITAVQNGAALCWRHVKADLRETLAKIVMRNAETIVRSMDADNPREAVLAASYLILQAAEEGLVVDVGSAAVLVAGVIWNEATTEDAADPAGWRLNQAGVMRAYGRALNAAQLAGHL